MLLVLFAFCVLTGIFLVYFINALPEKRAGKVMTDPERMVVASEQTRATMLHIKDKRDKLNF